LDGRDVVKGLLALDDEDPLRAGIYRDFKIGARELIDQQVKEQIRTQPLEYLEQVTGKIEELTLNLPEYFADSGFDKGNFTYKAKKLQKAMRELEATLAKQIEVDA
jgi:1,2-phenylacetyl-CoA epoxidase catalytic subunit